MSDVLDVEDVLRDLVVATVYPNGTAQPSIANCQVNAFAGWPNEASLDSAMTAGNVMVTVFPKQIERNTTRYERKPRIITDPAPSITATVVGNTITLEGAISTPQNVGLLVNGVSFVHAVQASDSLTSIAAALASLAATPFAGTLSDGAVITLGAGAYSIKALVGASATMATEVRRQERVFAITIWAPAPALRDSIAAAIDLALAQIDFLAMPDGFAARLLYRNSFEDDGLQKANVYRRDLNYSVEYATTVPSQAPQVLFPVASIAPSKTPTVPITL